jgi:hypothetical protein
VADSQTYSFELWSTSGVLLLDISRLCQNREYVLTRNAPMKLTFQLDLTSFEQFCAAQNINPATVLAPYQTDVKIKRNGQYIGEACQVVGLEFNTQTNDTGINTETGSYNKVTTITETIMVTAMGYLQILADRYYSGSYSNVDTVTVAIDLIQATQALTNGSIGVTYAGSQYSTGLLYSPTYSNQNILAELGNLTQIPGSYFDIYLDSSKVLHTAALMGSKRTDVNLTYGGPASNINGLYHQRTAAGALYNEIIGRGSGFGTDAYASTQDNTASQTAYMLRQNLMSWSNVKNQAQLNAIVAGELAQSSQLLEIPQLITTGATFAGLPWPGAGDRFQVYFENHPFLSNLNGTWFRVEMLDVRLDDNDFEYEMALTLDNFGFSQGA